MTRTSLRLRLLLFQPRASGAGGLGSLPEQPLGFPAPSPPGGRGGESRPGPRGPERPRDNGEEAAAAPGRAGSRESRLSLVGGRRGSLGSRSASAGQTSDPALQGRGLQIRRAGRHDGGGGGRGGACGRRRRWLRRAPPATPAPSELRVPARRACLCGAEEPYCPARTRPPEQASQPAPRLQLQALTLRLHAQPAWLSLTLRPHHLSAEPGSASPSPTPEPDTVPSPHG